MEECKLRVFENTILRRLFGLKRNKATREWRKLHNEGLKDLYTSPSIVWVIKSRRMRWAGVVAHMGDRRGIYRVLVGRPKGKRPLGRPRKIILRWIFRMCNVVLWTGSSWLRIGTSGKHL